MLRSYLGSVRLFSQDVRRCMVATALIGLTASGGIYSVLLNLYLLRLGYGSEFIGLVNAMSSLATVLLALPASALGLRWGTRRAMIGGLVLSVIGNSALPMVDGGPLRDVWILGTYLLSGLGMALYLVNVNPFLMEATTSAERNHVFSVRVALLPLAGFAGSLIGGALPGLLAPILQSTLDQPDPYRYPLLVAGLLLAPAIPVLFASGGAKDGRTARVEPNTPGPDRGLPRVPESVPLGPVLFLPFIGFLRVMGEGIPRAFLNVYLDTQLHVPTAQIGALVGLARLLAVPAGLLMPLLVAKWGTGQTVFAGALGVVLSLLPVALVPHWAAAGLGYMAMTALAAIARSAFIVHAMEAVPPRWQPTMSGATTLSAAVSWGVTAFAGGYLVDTVGYGPLFLIGAGLTLAGALLFWSRRCTSWGKEQVC